MIAVNDGKIVKIGQSPQLGRYLELQDATGNVYTYANLGSIPSMYPVPKPVKVTAKQIAQQLAAQSSRRRAPTAPASAGSQQGSAAPASAEAGQEIAASPKPSAKKPAAAGSPGARRRRPPRARRRHLDIATPMVKERLFAYPHRPASYAAGGALQISNSQAQISNFKDYFSDVLHLAKDQYTLEPLKAGAGWSPARSSAASGPARSTASHLGSWSARLARTRR